jgi:tRNA(Met) cytidine acetyltransferase
MDLQASTNEQLSQLQKQLAQLETDAQQHAHRYLVVLSGDEQWCTAALTELLPTLQHSQTLLISDHSSNDKLYFGIRCKSIQAQKAKSYLGSEIGRLIWNGFNGLNPDALGAASGLIKGGGFLFLILPDFATLSSHPDPDYLRMCRNPSELPSFGTRFLKRMVHLIQTDSEVTVIQQKSANQLSNLAPIKAQTTTNLHSTPLPQLLQSKSVCTFTKLTTDQANMVEAIQTVAKGHRNRPLVVLADRGRGKTSALGIAAASITLDQKLKVVITAPSRRACDAAFKHYQQGIDDQGLECSANIESAASIQCTANLEFFAPDALLESLPECHILLVDEAASIPAPMLKEMLEAYPRIVFSSTTHGYEGTGQGFNVRFRQTLDTLTPGWKSLTLHQPVRWADDDPLERWIFEFLLLKAQIPELPIANFNIKTTQAVQWVSQDALSEDSQRLKQVIALLVTAHYQTSPSDVRMILDDPNLHIGLLETDNVVIAVVLLLLEGGIDDACLAQNIIEGTRRPKGHLVPQALTSSTANPAFLTYQTYRVMRIAVHPTLSRKGLGTILINDAAKLGQQNQIDYLSASFGLTPLLNDFWGKNNFQLLRIGYHKDAASGAQSAIVVRALNSHIPQDILLAHEQYLQHFIFGLNTIYRALDLETTLAVLNSLAFAPDFPLDKPSPRDINIINAFAYHYRSFEDCAHILFTFILNCFAINLTQTLSSKEQQLICLRVLKGESVASCIKQLKLDGKKQLEITLKSAISKLLSLTIKSTS